jgi:hypothetical protein
MFLNSTDLMKGDRRNRKKYKWRNEEYYKTASVVYWSEFLTTQRRCIVFPVRYELNLYVLCRRK